MRRAALATFILSVALAPALARADQCAFVSQQQANDALELVEPGATVVCEPCGDAPATVRVESVSAAAAGVEDFWEVSINAAGIDLAYTFVENGDGKYVNLSKMVDCPSEGVSCLLVASFAALPTSCDAAVEEAKEDRLGGPDAAACSVGFRGETAFATLLLGLMLLGLAGRRAAAPATRRPPPRSR
jgi:hypothetical protein